ncbi:MAG: 3'-to-5' exoribonuclease RNase R [uncultured Sphingosinicella sp.]|uniref:Ribonuclease R n=1 Tax=uncultured Sphingosinicella sp. TaxID=478748 RepID=A0A6J4TP13_9SPHN|nr:VacB/RNase II family 3'-5' exoribonuclease [uncultured Sphingosinicella sp.]CAA9527406.1 MAG: 3'-to-5' exoribonuclease RNase R [uncultured Sphingosinicella sp.]
MAKQRTGLPSRQQILDFIESSDTPAGKREIAKAFGLSGNDKIALKQLLRDMGDEGLIDAAPGRAFHKMGGVPKVTVLRVVDVDDSGTAWAVPERWESDTPEPRLRLQEKGRKSAVGIGDRVLARTEAKGNGFIAHPMKKLLKGSELVMGVVHQEGDKLWLRPVDKRERRELPISDKGQAEVGDLVLAEKTGRPPRLSARVDAVLGDPFAPRSFSLIAIHKHGIPHQFSDTVLEEAERVAKQDLGPREDLTHIPIVAIDPADARDHDDAVWAAPDEDPANSGGWKAIVAIADVSFYVRSGSALDKEARKRGNSVYFPDRVVPMLPETLSAHVCSLVEDEDRAALVCHLQVTKDGQLKSWRFTRARVRIAANIAYEEAQAAIDAMRGQERIEVSSPTCAMPDIEAGEPPVAPEIVEGTLKPLWACWDAMYAAREKRGPLELDLPERRVVLDEKGRILSVAPRERLDAHKLIEDYMIAANVAAAKALEAKKAPVMYRDHEPPGREKLVALKEYLKTFDIEFALGQVVRPSTFNHIVERVGEADFKPQVMEQILRTQTQAYYGPENHGHFGLALGSYAHFTSPIRRYADLVVHRSLVRAYGLGEGGLTDNESEAMEVTGELISQLERRAMEAERDTIDRYVAAYLSERVGDLVDCRITGVQPFGFFATVVGLGGDGLVPVSTLGTDYFRYNEASQTLVGDDSGVEFAPGQRLKLRLAEANPVSGGLRFELPDASPGASARRTIRRDGGRTKGTDKRTQGKRGRPANIRHQGRK